MFSLTVFPVSGTITAAVVQVPQAAVPRQGVHHSRCTDRMDEGRLSRRC